MKFPQLSVHSLWALTGLVQLSLWLSPSCTWPRPPYSSAFNENLWQRSLYANNFHTLKAPAFANVAPELFISVILSHAFLPLSWHSRRSIWIITFLYWVSSEVWFSLSKTFGDQSRVEEGIVVGRQNSVSFNRCLVLDLVSLSHIVVTHNPFWLVISSNAKHKERWMFYALLYISVV